MELTFLLPVTDVSHVGEARRRAASLASTAGFDKEKISDISIIVTELASNLAKYAINGELIMQVFRDLNDSIAIEVLSLDYGPGIEDPQLCLTDGYSTSASLGTGLGAVQRLSDQFAIYSSPQSGTIIWSRNFKRNSAKIDNRNLDYLAIAKVADQVCGDAISVRAFGNNLRFIVADGLGHGPLAAHASGLAVSLQSEDKQDLEILMHKIHEQLKQTRGAAVALVETFPETESLSICSIGNISAIVVHPFQSGQHLLSQPGVVGYEARQMSRATYKWTRNSTLIIHSDGLSSHWNFDKCPGLYNQPAPIIAGSLVRGFRKKYDDCAVLVYKAK